MSRTTNQQKREFSFKAPEAREVLLAGDFTHWLANPIRLQRQPDGVWRATASLAPGSYHYRFYVDGEWRDDPECKLRVRNPFGTENDVLQIRPAKSKEPAEVNASCTAEKAMHCQLS